jgi:lipopolysaccharide/colanic/teichoic acid biosynthesis glycosyltransferase
MRQGSGVLEKNISSLAGEHGCASEESEESAVRDGIPQWKRAFDIIGASLCLVAASPILLVSALLIKCVSRGPVFFKQERIGHRGKTFVMWKLRTYEVSAGTHDHKEYLTKIIVDSQNRDNTAEIPMVKMDDHPGIIPGVGFLLRKLCIDEIPQLFNVLLGDMSLVGPRPAMSYEVKEYSPWQFKRLHAMPGMTGLWQVSGKNRLSFNEMVNLDLKYWEKKSPLLDIKILLKTPWAIAMQIYDCLTGSHESPQPIPSTVLASKSA